MKIKHNFIRIFQCFLKGELCFGITLVEIMVVIFIIGMLVLILVAGFPTIQKEFALSRATHKFAQDLRRAEDMALSGYVITSNVKGYGVFIDLSYPRQYIIYADRGDNPDYRYNQLDSLNCSEVTNPQADCVIEKIDLSKDAPGVAIKDFYNIVSNYTSINFNPPSPSVKISNLALDQDLNQYNRAGIRFFIESRIFDQRTVYVWTSGLIQIQ